LSGEITIGNPQSKDPLKVLGDVIGEPYSEEEDEKRADRWLKNMKVA
jgi:hypothetical protein